MDAAVPFALVAAVQLLALAAAFGLAGAGASAAFRRGSRGFLVSGGLLLAAAHGFTGAALGGTGGDDFAWVRAAGYLLIGLGFSGLATVAMAPIVVPLGAGGPAAAAAGAAALLAAFLSTKARRPGRPLLVAAMCFYAAAELLANRAQTSTRDAVALLVLRGVGSLAALAFVVRLVENSLLAKVVAAILAGVLGLALGTALVVGSVATDSLARDSTERLGDVAAGQVDVLLNEKQTSLSLAQVLARCSTDETQLCSRQVDATRSRATFVGFVCNPRDRGCLRSIRGGARFVNLSDPVTITALRSSRAVEEVVKATDKRSVATLDVVLGSEPSLVALGVAPQYVGQPTSPTQPFAAAVYATRIDADYVTAISRATGFGATLYVDDGRTDRRIASSLPDAQVAVLDRELARLRVTDTLGARRGLGGVSLTAEGVRPGVRFEAIRSENGDLVAVLALSAESDVILGTQRRVLASLFLGTVAVALLVGLLAVALGRRIVRPVTQLTLAASRVRRGDLDVRTEVRSTDELGQLSRTFDAMTESLSASNESLRRAADEEAALRGRLETVLDSIGDGLVTTDARNVVTGVNRAGRELLGATEADVVGRPVVEVLAGTSAAGEPLLGALGERSTGRIGRLERADGGSVPVALAATPLRGDEGHVVVVRDMTREHEVERMKTEFLSNVSHELRTPLTPIRGYAEILHRRPDLPADKTLMYAGSILESSVRMSRVVDLLVDVAALEAGRVEPNVAAVPVAAFVDERLEAWRKREPKREFRRRVAAKLPDLLIDPQWVAKAYDELVDNAVKYSAGPVSLTASLTDDGERVRLTVRDTGAGIPDDRRAALFTAFEQVDGSATRAVGGLGLGLSFVRRVADDFDLDVVVESTLGKGSAFSLEVPVAPLATPPAAGAARA
ncbi:MAG TPA: ATP-binding protein, partial [Frankiaceae bacterium]|nr:ATP-binding protein [Frankiaceae bacterium]